MAQPLVALNDVHKVFANGTAALRGLSLTVGEHEFVSFLGPSGCGKSTALRLIAGLAAVSAGQIEWGAGSVTPADAGSRPKRASSSRDDIGFVFQEPTLMPWASVFDNVFLPLRIKGVAQRQARDDVQHALSMVGLEQFAHVYPRELSGGMKMRVSIARSLVTKPRLLLMDEPFAALDELTRFRLNDDLLALWQAHRWTVVFVTHSVYESVYLSDRIVVFSARPGRIVADLPIGEPYPRGEEFRTSARYGELCRHASQALHRAMDPASAA